VLRFDLRDKQYGKTIALAWTCPTGFLQPYVRCNAVVGSNLVTDQTPSYLCRIMTVADKKADSAYQDKLLSNKSSERHAYEVYGDELQRLMQEDVFVQSRVQQ
jgi:hypothetical protein